eukprot:5791271-Pyramimonas_sp.AAC.1
MVKRYENHDYRKLHILRIPSRNPKPSESYPNPTVGCTSLLPAREQAAGQTLSQPTGACYNKTTTSNRDHTYFTLGAPQSSGEAKCTQPCVALTFRKYGM